MISIESHGLHQAGVERPDLAASRPPAVIPGAERIPRSAIAGGAVVSENGETTSATRSRPQTSQGFIGGHSAKTKTIATIGPDLNIVKAIKSGIGVFRINLASISREAALKSAYMIRTLAADVQRPVALLLDLQPSVDLSPDLSTITESQWADVRFGLECGIDWLALPPGWNGEALRQMRRFLVAEKRSSVGLLARLAALSSPGLAEVLTQEADGLILGEDFSPGESTEANASRRSFAQQCVGARKVVVVAAKSGWDAESHSSTPPDAWLSAMETAAISSAPTPGGAACETEPGDRCPDRSIAAFTTPHDEAIAAAVRQAEETPVDALVVVTRRLNTASLCAALRPSHARVFVFTSDSRLARRLRLHYALEPFVLPALTKPKAALASAEKTLRGKKLLGTGATVLFVTDPQEEEGGLSDAQLRTLG